MNVIQPRNISRFQTEFSDLVVQLMRNTAMVVVPHGSMQVPCGT